VEEVRRLVLRLEIEQGSSPINGSLSAGAGDLEVPFVGWIGLAGAIEEVMPGLLDKEEAER